MLLQIPIYAFDVVFSTEEPEKLPLLPFSSFRGAFGASLRAISCVLKSRKHCIECSLKESCAYGYLFETPRPHWAEKLRKYPYVPHPFVFSLPYPLKGKDKFTVKFSLFGESVRFFPYLVLALQRVCESGLGRKRCKLVLESIRDVATGKDLINEGNLSYPECVKLQHAECYGKLDIVFETPTTLRFNRDYVKPSELEFHVLIRNLLRRISVLSYFHARKELHIEYRQVIETASYVMVSERDLENVEVVRYSKRQNLKYKMRGFVGRISFSGNLSQFSSILWIGQYTHVGKYTSFGFGKYRISHL